jgi:hypothetical protein
VYALLFVFAVIVQRYPGNFGSKEKATLGEYCPTLDLSGWKDFSMAFKQLLIADEQNKVMDNSPVIIVGKWFPGGHLEFYTARTLGLPLLGIGPLQDIHKFAWLNHLRTPLTLGADAYCIVPSNIPFDVVDTYGRYFKKIDPPQMINQIRGATVVRYFAVYRLHSLLQIPPNILPLPR